MIKKKYLFIAVILLLSPLVIYSQENKYEYSDGMYNAKIKTVINNNEVLDIPKIEAGLIYWVKKNLFLMYFYMNENQECFFDLKNYSFIINIDNEKLEYRFDANHTSPDFTAVSFDIPSDDLLKLDKSESAVAVLHLATNKDGKLSDRTLSLNLKPEKTDVFKDFYDLGLKEKDKK